MVIWQEINQALLPLKGYADAILRFRESFAYAFVREHFDFTLPQVADYTRLGIGGDPNKRYEHYTAAILQVLDELHQAGVLRIRDLIARVETPEKLDAFISQSGTSAQGTASLLKYLFYWVIPMKKHLSGLVWADPETRSALRALQEIGIRANLDLLQRGLTPADRQSLARASGVPLEVVSALVNRADLSRMPWASKATISNIMGAGYGSLEKLANASPEQLYADFFRYGKTIGKNLKLGNEIENSHRIARLLPILVQAD